jgi:hypothetical protein
VARGAAVDDVKIRQPNLMDARLESPAQAHGISAIMDERQVVPLIAVPLAEMFFGRCNRKSQQQTEADNAECPHRIAEEGLPCRGKDFSHKLHLTPPWHNPGPARAAEPRAYSGEHNELEKKPGHNPVSQWFPGQIATEP